MGNKVNLPRIINPEKDCFIFIGNEPDDCLHFEPSRSYSVGYGLRVGKGSSQERLCRSEEGSRRVSSALVDKGVVPEGNSLLFLQSCRSDACTFEGMETTFKEQAQKVGVDGIFVFIFSGHGSQGHRGLVPLDCDCHHSYVTAAVLSRWLLEAECKAKCILFILNCCFAGEIAEATVREADNFVGASRLHVMAACSANEEAVTVPSLGCSTYSYFLSHAIRTADFLSGQFPVTTIHETCRKLTVALTSLLVTNRQEKGELVPDTMHPQLTHSTLHHVVTELSGEGEDHTDAEATHFARISAMYYGNKPRDSLADRSVAWIEETRSALIVLKEGLPDLDSHALAAILLSMLYSVAHLQMSSDRSSVVSANLFLTAYLYVAAQITTTFQDAALKFDTRLAAQALLWYRSTLLNNDYEEIEVDREFTSLSQLMKCAIDTDQRPRKKE